MLVQYKDPELLKNPYWKLRDNIQYRVVGITAQLEFSSYDLGRPNEAHAILIDRLVYDKEIAYGRAHFVPFGQLEILDYSSPANWSSRILSKSISRPKLVFGFKELLDMDFLVKIHDLNEEDEDNELLARCLEEYGGNITISDEERDTRNEYIMAEHEMGKIMTKLEHGYRNKKIINRYVKLLTVAASGRMRAISRATNDNEREILANHARVYLSYMDYLDGRDGDIDVSEKLRQLYRDSTGFPLLPSKAVANLIEKATNGGYDF